MLGHMLAMSRPTASRFERLWDGISKATESVTQVDRYSILPYGTQSAEISWRTSGSSSRARHRLLRITTSLAVHKFSFVIFEHISTVQALSIAIFRVSLTDISSISDNSMSPASPETLATSLFSLNSLAISSSSSFLWTSSVFGQFDSVIEDLQGLDPKQHLHLGRSGFPKKSVRAESHESQSLQI